MLSIDSRLQVWSPDTSITGAAVTGFTTPVYNQVSDLAPAQNARQMTVTSLGGTQGQASANSAGEPFTATFYKPTILKSVPAGNPVTGLRGQIPTNQYKLIVRKGGECAAGVPGSVIFRLTADVSAGMETYDPDNVRAAVSYFVGLLTEESSDLADTLITGVVP
jgi:hypothetical protein